MQWILALTLAGNLAAMDLAGIRAEPNLEKRSERALDYANVALDAARDAYGKGDFDECQAQLDEVGASVDVAYEALTQTGKDPSRNPKFFKRAEMRTRELLRRIDGLLQTVSYADREAVQKIHSRVSEVHDHLLEGIMSKRK
jgi:hypothetical protein